MLRKPAAYYLRNHPRDVARVAESMPLKQLVAFVATLSDDDQVLLFTDLLPQVAAPLLTAQDIDVALEIVNRLRTAVAATILGALPQSQRRPILDALSLETRTSIRHLLRYPDDAIGSIMLTNTLACRLGATVRQAKQMVRRFADTELSLMVVVDNDMKPVGLIAVSKLIRIREREKVDDHMRIVPRLIRAQAAVSSVLTSPAWNAEEYLPVVEADGRYVGLLPKARLHSYALAHGASPAIDSDLATTFLDIADLVWTPVAQMLARAGADNRGEYHER